MEGPICKQFAIFSLIKTHLKRGLPHNYYPTINDLWPKFYSLYEYKNNAIR